MAYADNPIWTEKRLKDGFDRFVKENGRLPTAPEVDQSSYLPSARSIQRSHGGLRRLRGKLGYEDVDFGVGKHRTALANKANESGIAAEIKLEKILVERFGQVFVHTQRRYGDGKARFDFVVYTKKYTFGVDVFHTSTARDMQKNINLKMGKYGHIVEDYDLFFVVSSTSLDQKEITKTTINMSKINYRKNIFVIHIDKFISHLENYHPITDLAEVVEYYPYGKTA